MTLFELQRGIERTRKQDTHTALALEVWIRSLTSTMPVLPLDGDICRETARLMVRQSDELLSDAFIAATARVHRLNVATRNMRDFKRFAVPVFNPFTYSH